jgi:hypothetical protein
MGRSAKKEEKRQLRGGKRGKTPSPDIPRCYCNLSRFSEPLRRAVQVSPLFIRGLSPSLRRFSEKRQEKRQRSAIAERSAIYVDFLAAALLPEEALKAIPNIWEHGASPGEAALLLRKLALLPDNPAHG